MKEVLLGPEKQERGKNTKVTFTFVRHSQKKSGNVFDGAGVSLSNLSIGGIDRAGQYGKKNLTDRKVNRAYATEIDRTEETLRHALESAGIDIKVLQKKQGASAFFELPIPEVDEADADPEINKKYVELMDKRKKEYINEHFPNANFKQLSSDEQEEIMEYAEEESVDWLVNEAKDKSGVLISRFDATGVAFKVNRLLNLPDYMPGGRVIDLVSSGHKTSTEAFLKYALIQDNGKHGLDSLEEIGGSLKILDSWDLVVENDMSGHKKVSFVLKRENGSEQKFDLDLEEIKKLAGEYMEAKNIKAKKIDAI
ncbi:hypothetical protein A2478_01425 [Candidatus Falkowbacteria bacterium RIFOXYC2_FULL_36_12]|uniref:Histidine phosphatase family protein n=1 Tax=Candidatus Falkowbacteria bacterium RIFOXYC2_FULL_36_12 TaxID=1798002 RepID=A0A1F5T2Y7_9BACT|nr:MAG: hypothetical protein A2478_01425 [Candidatus Falkowbacteria bacterium RIFOXYC2_FULL_36_12]